VFNGDGMLASIPLGDLQLHLSLSTVLQHVEQADSRHAIASGDEVVVCLVRKCQRDDSLLLEVGLVDSRKALGEDDATAEVSGLESGVFTRGSLAVVGLGNDEPFEPFLLPLARQLGDAHRLAVEIVGHVDLVRLRVHGADESVVGNVLEVALVLEPRTRSRNVVGRALALYLEEDLKVCELRVAEGLEGLQKREAVGGRGDDNRSLGRGNNGGRGSELKVAGDEAVGGEFRAGWRGELERATVRSGDRVGQGVEGGGSGVNHGSDKL
jgi:hypothetical protein